MFDANMRHLPKGHKFIADVWGLKETSPLAKAGIEANSLILCTMLDDCDDNPSVMVHLPSGEDIIVKSYNNSIKGELFMHHVLYYGTVEEDGKLVDFRYEKDYVRAQDFMRMRDEMTEGVLNHNDQLYYKGFTGSVEWDEDGNCWHGWIQGIEDFVTYEGDFFMDLKLSFIERIEDYLATKRNYVTKCKDHPLAPHGFNRDASHCSDEYVCDCEGWIPPANYVGISHKTYLVLEEEDSQIISIQKEGGILVESFLIEDLEWLLDKENFDNK